MFGKRIDLFKLFGFEVRIDLSWVILAILIAWSLSAGLFPFRYEGLSSQTYWIMGIVGAIGLFFSIFVKNGFIITSSMTDVDALTGLLNRAVMERDLEREQASALRAGRCFTIAMIDADHSKKVNVEYGHGFGDVVLETLAGRFVESIRRSM